MKTQITPFIIAVLCLSPFAYAGDQPTEAPDLIAPVDVNTLPVQSRRDRNPLVRRPMVDVGLAGEIVDGGPENNRHRILVRVAYSGLGPNPNPYADTHYFAIDAQIGIDAEDSDGSNLSRIMMRFTPVRMGIAHGDNENFHLNNLALRIAPIEFERELAIGVRERLEISLVGLQIEHHGPHWDDELMGIHGIFRASAQALGYAFQNLVTANPENNQHAFSIGGAQAQLGFGLGDTTFSLEIVADARTSLAVSHSGLNATYEVGVEIRFNFRNELNAFYPRGLRRPDGGRSQRPRRLNSAMQVQRYAAGGSRGIRVNGYLRWTAIRGSNSSVGPGGQSQVSTFLVGLDLGF